MMYQDHYDMFSPKQSSEMLSGTIQIKSMSEQKSSSRHSDLQYVKQEDINMDSVYPSQLKFNPSSELNSSQKSSQNDVRVRKVWLRWVYRTLYSLLLIRRNSEVCYRKYRISGRYRFIIDWNIGSVAIKAHQGLISRYRFCFIHNFRMSNRKRSRLRSKLSKMYSESKNSHSSSKKSKIVKVKDSMNTTTQNLPKKQLFYKTQKSDKGNFTI